MAEYETSFDKAGGYSFDEQAIRDLWTQARAHVGNQTEIGITLEGDHRIKVKDIDEFFSDAFIKRNFIEQISISGGDVSLCLR